MECPVCNRELPLVEHHIHGRGVIRWREDWNVAWVCGACHDLIHQGEIVIEGWVRVDGILTLIYRCKGEGVKILDGATPPTY